MLRLASAILFAQVSFSAATVPQATLASDGAHEAAGASAIVSTFAGPQAGGGYRDGEALQSKFSAPAGVTVCSNGDVLVADTGNHVIRRLRDGIVTTVAGRAVTAGGADGVATEALFNFPRAVASDANCNVFIADSGNHTIRMLSGGRVRTLAGITGVKGFADGQGSARFDDPADLTLGTDGALYVADRGNNVIRRVTVDGVVSTIAGDPTAGGSNDGTGSGARFLRPESIASDIQGNLYVSDSGNVAIRRVSAAGVVTTVIKGGERSSRLDLAISPEGVLYWSDLDLSRIQRLAGSAVETVAGGVRGWVDGTETEALFRGPKGVAFATDGSLLVVETINHTVRRLSAGRVQTIAGTAPRSGTEDGPAADARFYAPSGIARGRDGNYYVGDGGRVRKVSPDGRVTSIAGSSDNFGTEDGVGFSARFVGPITYLAADSDGNVYVTQFGQHTVRKIAPDGAVTTIGGKANQSGFTDGSRDASRFRFPRGVAIDTNGDILVADAGNGALRRIKPSGEVTTVDREFGAPMNLEIDGEGNLYYIPEGALTLLKRTPAGMKTILATVTSPIDGEPQIARASDGTIFAVASRTNVAPPTNAVWMIPAEGSIRRVAGKDYSPGYENGIASEARFSIPSTLTEGLDGRLLVVDSQNFSIRAIGFQSGPIIITFSPDRRVIAAGESVVLRWTTSGGTDASISQGIGVVPLSGEVTVRPSFSTTYTLIVTGPGGTSSATTDVILPALRRRVKR